MSHGIKNFMSMQYSSLYLLSNASTYKPAMMDMHCYELNFNYHAENSNKKIKNIKLAQIHWKLNVAQTSVAQMVCFPNV